MSHLSRPLASLAALMAVLMSLTTPSLAQRMADCGQGAPTSPFTASPESPRPLTEQGLRNLVAFTRLLGYVRHFHPSDQAAAAEWDRLAIEGMRRIEACEGPEQLAVALEAFFRPVAPTVQVFPSGAQRDPPPALAQPAGVVTRTVVSWRHWGAGQGALPLGGSPSIYSSERVSTRAFSIRLFSSGPKPGHIFTARLDAGIGARVPLKLYADATGTLPHGPPPAAADKSPLSADDRGTRLAAVALAWNVFQHFYPYFDVVDTDWPRALATALTAAATDADERAFLDTLRRLVAALHDGHGRVTHPTLHDLEQQSALPLAWALVEGKLVIIHPLAEAVAAGLTPGDVVLEINGQATEDALANARQLISAATPQWKRYRLATHLGGGPPGSLVRLKVQTLSGTQREVELRRAVKPEVAKELRPATVMELEPGITYFDVDRAKAADWTAALPKLAGAKAVIFDLRGYPRLYMSECLPHLSPESLQSPFWQVPIITQPDRLGVAEYDTSRWNLPPQSPRLKGRIIFLIDGRAISAAESAMGIIEAYKLADIVGEPTAGTNGNVNAFAVPGGYTLYWTGMRVLKHDGSRHHGVGIHPTHPVARTIKGVAERRDEILEKGLQLARQFRP